jgi:hypothetical protein
MELRVHLAVLEHRVPTAVWDQIYEKARQVTSRWMPRPLSPGWRRIGGVRVEQYSLDIETAEGLVIVGDAETLTTGDSFVVPKRLEDIAPPADDVVADIVRSNVPEIAECVPWSDLFGAKTYRLPYHVLIVALGLLVEHSLPRTAVVYGDVSLRDGELARRGLKAILGESFELPIVVDEKRLRRRLKRAVAPDLLDRAVDELIPPDPAIEAALETFAEQYRSRVPAERVDHELEHIVCSCSDPDHLSAETRQLLHRLLSAIRRAVAREGVRERVEEWGVVRTRKEIALRVRMSKLCLTSKTWDLIEAADLDELTFLYGAACIDTTRRTAEQAVRAILENPALRSV